VGTLTGWSTCAANGGGATSHCASIKTDGTLWTWGLNTLGQLGLGVATNRSSPVQVGTLGTWKNVAVGDSHTMAIKTDGTLWGWGINSSGQLGLEVVTNRSSPVQVGTLTDWSSVSAGNNQTIAIKTDGTAWAWGSNVNGRLGLGDSQNRSSPVQVGALTNWVSGSATAAVSAILNSSGIVYTAGNNGTVSVNALGRYVTSTFDRSSPVQVGTLTNWSSISLKYNHCLAITTAGSLYVWGANSFGQLGDWAGGPISPKSSPVQVGTLTDWSTVQAGDFHSVGTKTDGTLWTWGLNDSGQLGLGVVTNRSSPVQLGTLATWNKSSAGVSFTMAIKTDGTLWGWGLNTGGQLGLDAIGNFNKSSPVQVGTSISWHSVSIDEVQSILIKRYQ
jgi:alpha-tubulin suppressor-like RCC1 family protein